MTQDMMTYDAVVIGAGPNGLVAANRLVDAGWSVLVLEQQETVGGAVRSDREVHPDFVHDTFSAFYPLSGASRTIADLHLEDHGLVWEHAPAVLGHPFPDGSWGILHRDREVTARLAEEQHPGDGEAWLDLCHEWDLVGGALIQGLLTPFPPLRPVPRGLVGLVRAGGLRYVKTLLTPAAEIATQRFGGRGVQALVCGNAGHADIPLDAPGSGLMGILMTMLGQTVGFPVPRGGAGELSQALARRFQSLGGEVRCGAPVERIDVRDGRVRSVRTADGSRYDTRNVVAAVTAVQLYGAPRLGREQGLLHPDDVPARVREGMRQFTLDPSTVKVDWALNGPVPWAGAPPYAPGTVHVADDVTDMTAALGQVTAGLIPAKPFMLSGQMTTSDATRSPAGTESFWAYTHVPQHPSGDAGEDGLTGRWDADERERFADRMQARFERLAPGFGDRVLARRVLGPHELESRDANLIGGAINGGTSQLHQELVFRPVSGLGRAETGVRGLFLGSASAHPGGGVHGAAGNNAARAALAHARWRFPRRSAP
ncbi:MAG: NAD(P)/FAD-dependent oxidoreductase [Marmoricola sp.]|nr:NAD(P)/FAD-dependent oxidoreductase [Marmoricola sp.]